MTGPIAPGAGKCGWCGGDHAIEFCPAVMAAFVKDYDYQGNVSSSAAANPRKFRGKALGGRRKKLDRQGNKA